MNFDNPFVNPFGPGGGWSYQTVRDGMLKIGSTWVRFSSIEALGEDPEEGEVLIWLRSGRVLNIPDDTVDLDALAKQIANPGGVTDDG